MAGNKPEEIYESNLSFVKGNKVVLVGAILVAAFTLVGIIATANYIINLF